MAIFNALPFILQNGTIADASQVMSDFNKIISDGNANAAENGVNSSITALLGLTSPIPVVGGSSTHFIGATSAGTAAAQTIASTTPANWSLTRGFEISFLPGFSSVAGGTTLNVGGTGALSVRKPTPTGPAAIGANDWVAGQMVTVVYDGTAFLTQSEVAYPALFAQQASLASAATTDLGTVGSHNILVTGSTTITSFGSTAVVSSPIYLVEFNSPLKLTYNATSMQLPGGTDIAVQASDWCIAMYMGSGNWQVMSYYSALPTPGVVPVAAGFKNLIVQATADTVLSFTADELMLEDANGRVFKASNVSLTNTITGSGANGLDTGAVAASNFYSVWAIYSPLTNTLASLVSLSATGPTMPAGYTYRMRVGWVFFGSTSRLFRTIQRGRTVQITVGTFPLQIPIVANGAVGGWSNTSPTLSSLSLVGFVPSTAAKVVLYVWNSWKGLATSRYAVAPDVSWGGTNNGLYGSNGQLYPIAGDVNSPMGGRTEIVLESLAVAAASDNNGFALGVGGWEDNI